MIAFFDHQHKCLGLQLGIFRRGTLEFRLRNYARSCRAAHDLHASAGVFHSKNLAVSRFERQRNLARLLARKPIEVDFALRDFVQAIAQDVDPFLGRFFGITAKFVPVDRILAFSGQLVDRIHKVLEWVRASVGRRGRGCGCTRACARRFLLLKRRDHFGRVFGAQFALGDQLTDSFDFVSHDFTPHRRLASAASISPRSSNSRIVDRSTDSGSGAASGCLLSRSPSVSNRASSRPRTVG